MGSVTGSDRFVSKFKPHYCDACGKSFYLKGDYTRHLRVHTGETPFTCDYCGRGFKQKGAMDRHRWKHERDEALKLEDSQKEKEAKEKEAKEKEKKDKKGKDMKDKETL